MRSRSTFTFWLLAVAAFVASGPVAASDGVLEINQACVANGCFPGDLPGFPVEIIADGSYLLTSNLTVPDENTTAILGTANVVTVDLGGFLISGVTVCSGNPIVCTPTGSGTGVELGVNGLGAVRNGTVRAMGNAGVRAAGSHVTDIVAERNGGTGVENIGGTTRDCIVRSNGGGGINGSALVVNNIVVGNALTGISSTAAPTVRGNWVRLNGGLNDSPGIRVVDGFVWENNVQFSRGFGLDADGTTVYGNNRFQSNNLAGGTSAANQVDGGTQLGPNLCAGVPCP